MSEHTDDKSALDGGPTFPERPVTLELELTINGDHCRLTCEPGDTLLTVLRRLGLFSVRFGSGTGESGAAAVLFDGRIVSADVMLAAQANGHEVTTVESLDVTTGELDPIQQAFVDIGALQSGYSAGAMVLAAKALIEADPDPSEVEIRDAFSGILDRETGYVKLVEAIRRAAAARRGEKVPPVELVVLEPLTGPTRRRHLRLQRKPCRRRQRCPAWSCRVTCQHGSGRKVRAQGRRLATRQGTARLHR